MVALVFVVAALSQDTSNQVHPPRPSPEHVQQLTPAETALVHAAPSIVVMRAA